MDIVLKEFLFFVCTVFLQLPILSAMQYFYHEFQNKLSKVFSLFFKSENVEIYM